MFYPARDGSKFPKVCMVGVSVTGSWTSEVPSLAENTRHENRFRLLLLESGPYLICS